MRTRSVFHCGPRNEKQARTLTDAEDCCEDVCIVLICGWSVDVLCQHFLSEIQKKHEHACVKTHVPNNMPARSSDTVTTRTHGLRPHAQNWSRWRARRMADIGHEKLEKLTNGS